MPTHVPLQTATPTPRPQSTDHPSRRAKPAQKKGAERVPRLLGSVSYRLLLGICGSQITGLSTRGPLPYPERGESGPASRPLGASVFARQLGGPSHLGPSAESRLPLGWGRGLGCWSGGFWELLLGGCKCRRRCCRPFFVDSILIRSGRASISMSSTSIPSTSENSPDKCPYHRIFVADPILTQNAPTIYPNPLPSLYSCP